MQNIHEPLSRTQCLNFGWEGYAPLLHLIQSTSCAKIWVKYMPELFFSISWNALRMLFCTLSWIRVDDSLGGLLVGSFIGLGKNYWQIITGVKNGSKNSALVYHFLLLYALKFVRRSEWAVENPRFPSVGAEVNSTSARRIEPFYREIFL